MWATTNSNGCVIWSGRLMTSGYGRISINGKYQGTHRISYELTHGPIEDGLEIHHKCENKRCINVKHLKKVTVKKHRKLHPLPIDPITGRFIAIHKHLHSQCSGNSHADLPNQQEHQNLQSI